MSKSVRGGVVYTGKSVERNAWVNFSGSTVESVTQKPKGEPAGEFPVLTPALVDPHCHIGMLRSGEPAGEQEANDKMESLLPLADALDSVLLDDAAFANSLAAGVLYSCVVPGSGNIIGGRAAVIRNYAADTSSALIGRAGIKAAFGHNPRSVNEWKGRRPFCRMGAVALLREQFETVRTKLSGKDKKRDPLTAAEKVYADLMDGKELLRAHVHKTDDIAALLRLADEYRLRLSVEHALDVHDIDTFKSLAKRGIPVVYGPMCGFNYKVELRNCHWRNLEHLLASGVKFGLMTDHPVVSQEDLFYCTRWLLQRGLSRQGAVELLTRVNAWLVGLDKILGTLQKGKWASFVCWNGDPFDLASRPAAVYAEGKRLQIES